MKRIAIFRLSSLGDLVHTMPALAAIKANFPDSHVSWFVEPPGDKLLGLFSGIDEIVKVRLRGRGLRAPVREALELRKRYRTAFDLLLDFQGLLKSAILMRFFGGMRLGFNRKNLREPAAACCYTRRAFPFDEGQHVIRKNLHLLHLLGIHESRVHFPLRPLAPSTLLGEFLDGQRFSPGSWVAVNVGGGWPTKVLTVPHWREVMAKIDSRYPVLLLWGNEGEKRTAEEIAKGSNARLAPFLEFTDLAWTLQRSALLVSGDTLALHLADAVGTRSLGLFGPTSPQRNGSILSGSHSLWEDVGCNSCFKRRCDTIRCMNAISADRIALQVDDMMKNHG